MSLNYPLCAQVNFVVESLTRNSAPVLICWYVGKLWPDFVRRNEYAEQGLYHTHCYKVWIKNKQNKQEKTLTEKYGTKSKMLGSLEQRSVLFLQSSDFHFLPHSSLLLPLFLLLWFALLLSQAGAGLCLVSCVSANVAILCCTYSREARYLAGRKA